MKRSATIAPEDKLITATDLRTWLGIHPVTLYKMKSAISDFPKPIQFRPGGRLYWREATIRGCIAERERDT